MAVHAASGDPLLKQPVRRRRPLPTWRRHIGWLTGLVLIVAACLVVRWFMGADDASAQSADAGTSAVPATSATSIPAGQAQRSAAQQTAAIVNGRRITRDALAKMCLDRYGEDVLEKLVSRRLIEQECKRRQNPITVTDQEIEAEIDNNARRFGLTKDHWLKMLKERRGVSHRQYARDVIWPMLALRKLAGDQVVPTAEEIQQEYESQFGPSVRARILVVDNETKARQLYAQLVAQPDEFVRLTRQHSIDINSASNGGLIQPIRRHVGDPNIEQAAFSMQPGEISRILKVGNQFVILKCEGRLPAREVPVEKVKPKLAEHIRQGKLREESVHVFQNLQKHARIENVYNNPQLRTSMPGVVAKVNDEPIMMRELAEECLAVYGEPVLENEINQLLLQQEMQQHKLQTTQADLDAEVAHAAQLAGVVDAQGRPDIARWMQLVTQEEGVTRETYYSDVVWPSVALKKLTHGKVEVTEEDMRKGFEANYGPRAQCRVIVMDNQRRAQEVWDKARNNPTAENFGKLAEEYSLDAGSRQRGGEVPPLKRYGGHELLEKQAFALKPGEISGVIQVGQQYVILFCEGYTKPVKVAFAEVRDLIHRDLFEKKLRITMSNEFVDIQERAQIDNFLAGTSQSPKRPDPVGTAAERTDTAVRPVSANGTTRR